MLRGHAGEPTHILVLSTLGAPQRRLLGSRKARDVAGDPEPEPVPTARALLAGAEPFASPDAARAWLGDADLEAEADSAVASLNYVLHGHRVAAADPFAREVSRAQAIAVRVGIGEGEQIAHGRLTDARQLPPYRSAKVKREAALRPQERLAAILGGRDAALACEELTLRARLDVERGRWREAAFQIRVALEAALAELEPWVDRAPGLAERLGDLREQRGPVGGAANTALQGGLSEEDIEDVEHALGLIEAALRARTAMGID